jgi:NAD+ kinase
LKKLADSIKRVGLIANTEKVSCRPVIQKAAALIAKSGRTVLTEAATAEMARLKVPTLPNAALLAKQADLLVVFGGDGTMLRAAREVADSNTPIIGINVGGMGFLTAASSAQLVAALKQVWAGDFVIEPRPLLYMSGTIRGREVGQRALNDIVISRGSGSRLIELEVSVDGQQLTRYRCDGLIFSSPTGSTAYSLAAGGAIVSPGADVFTITPICPHTLSNRSVILDLGVQIGVKVITGKPESIVAADGEPVTDLQRGDSVLIRRSRRSTRVVRLAGSSFFQTLRQKLHWSGSNV